MNVTMVAIVFNTVRDMLEDGVPSAVPVQDADIGFLVGENDIRVIIADKILNAPSEFPQMSNPRAYLITSIVSRVNHETSI